MSFVRDLLVPTTSNVPLTRVTTPQAQAYHHDDSTEPGPSTVPLNTRHPRTPEPTVPPYDDEEDDFNARAAPRRSSDRFRLYPPSAGETTLSICSTATNTPVHSRRSSPLPFYYSGTSSCSSDSESEPEFPLLGRTRQRRSWRERERPRWWPLPFGSGSGPAEGNEIWRRRRRWRDVSWGLRSLKRVARRLIRHPFFPKTPVTILLTLLFLTIFGVSLTFLLIYILNPDKEPLPWRGYCTLPQHSAGPPPLSLSPTAFLKTPITTKITMPMFPPPDFDSMAPAGVFVGVFSMDTSVERRMLVRSTWANHIQSREGAGEGDGGVGTSRTIVRFILAQPRKDWERRVKLEMETYKDMVILPIPEKMNDGKTYAFFSWAANHSWVPPLYFDGFDKAPKDFTYLNVSNPAPALAMHDPVHARRDQENNPSPRPWVKPDYVVKADDDSFIMLAELEAHLRVELYKDPLPPPPPAYLRKQQTPHPQLHVREDADESHIVDFDQIAEYFSFYPSSYLTRPPPVHVAAAPNTQDQLPASPDPLIFWGYLVKNRFMAGELYALSFSLVNWVATDAQVKTMTRGAEDKQTSKWIRAHPRAQQVRWSSERCWIYDHPRAGTVYSHGFLFPSERKRVQEGVLRDLGQLAQQAAKAELSTTTFAPLPGQDVPPPEKWTHSTVSKFHVRYSPPVSDLSLDFSVEALVEGSEMSMVHDDTSMTPELAWKYREGRRTRYGGQRVGGTIVVHFIKKNMWFLETAAALLHGDEVTALERAMESIHGLEPETKPEPGEGNGEDDAGSLLPSVDTDPEHPATTSTSEETEQTLTSANLRTWARRSRRNLGQ